MEESSMAIGHARHAAAPRAQHTTNQRSRSTHAAHGSTSTHAARHAKAAGGASAGTHRGKHAKASAPARDAGDGASAVTKDSRRPDAAADNAATGAAVLGGGG